MSVVRAAVNEVHGLTDVAAGAILAAVFVIICASVLHALHERSACAPPPVAVPPAQAAGTTVLGRSVKAP